MLELEGGREGSQVPGVWEPCIEEQHTSHDGFTSFTQLMSDLEIDQELSNLGGREGRREAAHQDVC